MAEAFSSDADLLRRFQKNRDEEAFGELVRRHGPLVWGVCRRRLERLEDAEDAFQATFLVLAIKGGTIRHPEALGGWLHRTAARLAGRAATQSPRPASEEQPAAGLDALAQITRREMIAAVDVELEALPRRYRDVIVLFHLEGESRRDIAERLGLSEQAVKARLSRGRALLRSRLTRRGVALPLLLPLALEPLPAGLSQSATRLGSTFGRARLTPGDLLTTTLSQEVSPMISLMTGKTGLALLAACVGLALTWAIRGPVQAADEGDGETPVVIDTSLDDPERASEATLLAMLEKGDDQKDAEKQAKNQGKDVARKRQPEPNVNQSYPLRPSLPEVKILEALDSPVRAEFPGISLRDALRSLATQLDMNIVIDDVAIEEAGLSADVQIDLFLSGIQLQSALNLMLERHGLTYVLNNEVLTITTKTDATTRVVTRGYTIPTALQGQPPEDTGDRLTKLVLSRRGSSGDEEPIIETFQDRILVVAPLADHKHLRKILRLLSYDLAGQGGK